MTLKIKGLTILLAVLLFASAPIVAHSASAKSTPNPSVPQFTARFVNAFYTVTNTNPYTGAIETQLISNSSIEVAIKNQPWKNSDSQIYYNIRVKPHFAGNWTEIYPLRNLSSSYNNGVFTFAEYISFDTPMMPSSGSIGASFRVVATEYYGESGYDVQRYYSGDEGQQGEYFAFLHGIPYGSQLDFQVEALAGYNSTYWYVMHPLYPQFGGSDQPAIAFSAASGWSKSQTVIIGDNAGNQTPTPSVPEFPTIAIVPLLAASLVIALILRNKQFTKTSQSQR